MWYWLGWGVTDIRRCNRATRSMSQWQCTANLTLYRCLFQLRAAVIEESSPHCTKQRFNTYGVLWIWNLKGTCPVFSRNETSPFFFCPLLGLQQRIVGWCGNHESFESEGDLHRIGAPPLLSRYFQDFDCSTEHGVIHVIKSASTMRSKLQYIYDLTGRVCTVSLWMNYWAGSKGTTVRVAMLLDANGCGGASINEFNAYFDHYEPDLLTLISIPFLLFITARMWDLSIGG